MPDVHHAIVLTAGLGTRLRPLTLVRAKPAIPVAGIPLVRRILSWLAGSGIDDVVLNLHYLPATITSLVGDGSDLGTRVRYSWEQPLVLGSAGGPRLALPLLNMSSFVIVNGDTLTDVDVRALIENHANSGALVTLALIPNREYLRYGGVLLDSNRQVTGVVRKGPEAQGSFHFTGVQVANASAFQSLPPEEKVNSIGGLYDRLWAERPGTVRGFVTDAAFYDIGTIEDYLSTSARLSGAAQGAKGSRVQIDSTARVSNSIVWDDVTVGPQCVIEDCILTDRVRVPAGSTHRQSILMTDRTGLVSVPLPPQARFAADPS